MMKMIMRIVLAILLVMKSMAVWAAVITEDVSTDYKEHPLSRSEKKCIEEGYQITYANCVNQTAPVDRCPHHDAYYRSCSQEQWCRNNNYTFLAKDCETPTYPVKMCDNDFPIYRACKKDVGRACMEKGFVSAASCPLSDVRCDFDQSYGKCCDECPDFPYDIKNIPEGYVADGDTCRTCSGIVKTRIKEAVCEGYNECQFGPASQETPHCVQGNKVLYSLCKSAERLCREKGYVNQSCSLIEDAEVCPEDDKLKKCHINCYKYASSIFPEDEVVEKDTVNPDLDESKKGLRSLFGEISPDCTSKYIPTVVLNLNKNNYTVYRTLFNRNIQNMNFELNFEDEVKLEANGQFENVSIKIKGKPAQCALEGKKIAVKKRVMISGNGNLCADVDIDDLAKFTTEGSIKGNVNMGSNAQLGIKGNLEGFLRSAVYCQILIKGKLQYKNPENNAIDNEGIAFGCNNKVKIGEGITAEKANVLLRQYTVLDAPSIDLVAVGNDEGGEAGLHVYKHAKIENILDNSEYLLAENNSDFSDNCDDKYIVNNISALQGNQKALSLNAASLLADKWQCRTLNRLQMQCK